MNELDKLIKENSALFDDAEPVEGHFERFEQKLNAQAGQKRKLPYAQVLKIAAVAILLIISSVWVIEKISATNNKPLLTLGDLSEEYREAEFYYTSTAEYKIEELNQMFVNDSTEREMVLQELKEMDEVYNKLLKEFNANPEDERVVFALVQHYQMKVKILNRIINQLKNVKPKTQNSHEKVEV